MLSGLALIVPWAMTGVANTAMAAAAITISRLMVSLLLLFNVKSPAWRFELRTVMRGDETSDSVAVTLQ
jgi:hypothetical protein